jgi:protein-disulfide isomerase
MKKDTVRVAVIAGVLIVGLGFAAGVYLRSEKEQRTQQVATQAKTDPAIFVRPHSQALGPANAKVTVVEFLDPECESCRASFPMVKQLLAGYGGRVRLVVRYMPFHKNSVYAASALEAAAQQGKFWEMLAVLFENQPLWGDHHAPKPELIPEYAQQIGLDMTAFNASINSPRHKEVIETDREDGKKLGVVGTPTFFVNGRLVDPLGYDTLKGMIDQELAK